MKKNSHLVVPPRCAHHRFYPEGSDAGVAQVALNLRQQEQSLVVTGSPRRCGSVTPGHRLLLVDGAHTFTSQGGGIYCDGAPLTTTAHDIIAMHRVGEGIVVVTSGGLIHVRYTGNGCVVVDKADAMPSITLTATEPSSFQQTLDAVKFDTPYTSWRAPLAQGDVARLVSMYRTAWKTATAHFDAIGAFHTPVMACYGLRLWDDNYLCFSVPVALGMDTADNASMVTAQAVTESSRYTGIEQATMTMNGYRLGIMVNTGVAEHWLAMVKSVDVFVTDRPMIADTTSLDYRCITTQGGSRVTALQYGWQPVSSGRIQAQLEASGWTLVASTTDIGALSRGKFVAANVAYPGGTATGAMVMPLEDGLRITRRHVDNVERGGDQLLPVASIVRNGRLYIAQRDGRLASSAHGNAMYITQDTRVTGASIMALAPVSRPIYSGGFGRYVVYLFTDDGIYAVAQSATGTLGEARLVDRSVIAPGSVPVDGNRDIYYVDRNGWLCCLTGCMVSRLVPGVLAGGMAWDDAHGELYCRDHAGVIAVSPTGDYSHRSIDVLQFYDDVLHALAVGPSGELLDLTVEDDTELPVEYQSHPVTVDALMRFPVKAVTWCVTGDDASLSLELTGERGASCHGFRMARLRASGRLSAPLHVPLVAPPCRTVRLHIAGSALTGTVIHATTLST